MIAARAEKEKIDREAIESARDKILLGLERKGMVLTRDECRLLAYHEAGHAVLGAVLEREELSAEEVLELVRGREDSAAPGTHSVDEATKGDREPAAISEDILTSP